MLEWKGSIRIETILKSLVCLLILVSNVLNIKFEESKEYILGLGRFPGERNGYPLQYSGLENSMDCIVYGVSKSWTWLRDFHKERIEFYTLYFHKKKNDSKPKLQKKKTTWYQQGVNWQFISMIRRWHLKTALLHF